MANEWQVMMRERLLSAPFFVFVLIGIGIGLHGILPSIPLIGMRNILSDAGVALSSYIGGLGISFVLGSVGALGGMAIRYLFDRPGFKNRVTHAPVAIMFLIIGAIFAVWYAWSVPHATAIIHNR